MGVLIWVNSNCDRDCGGGGCGGCISGYNECDGVLRLVVVGGMICVNNRGSKGRDDR